MAVPLIEVADALVDEINGFRSDIGLYAEASRNYGDSEDDITDLSDIQVDVIPFAATEDQDTTTSVEYLCAYNVLVRKRIGADAQVPTTGKMQLDEIDGLIDILHKLWERLVPSQNTNSDHTGRLTTESNWSAAFDIQQSRVVYYFNPKHLKRRQYTGLLRLAYTVSKEPDSVEA